RLSGRRLRLWQRLRLHVGRRLGVLDHPFPDLRYVRLGRLRQFWRRRRRRCIRLPRRQKFSLPTATASFTRPLPAKTCTQYWTSWTTCWTPSVSRHRGYTKIFCVKSESCDAFPARFIRRGIFLSFFILCIDKYIFYVIIGT